MKQLLTLLFIGLMSLCAQTLPAYVATNGLVGWWQLDGNVNDLSSNQLNGSAYNAVATVDRNNNLLSALSFNGNNSYTEVNSNSKLDSIVNELTISVWIKPNIQANTGTIVARRKFCRQPKWRAPSL